MATYRFVHAQIWEDDWFVTLDAESKLLWIYLITNHRASVAGIYVLSERVIPFETGLTMGSVRSAMHDFESDGKLMYGDNVVWLFNMRKYQDTGSDAMATGIKNDIDRVPDCRVKTEYLRQFVDRQGPSKVPKVAKNRPSKTVDRPSETTCVQSDPIPSQTIRGQQQQPRAKESWVPPPPGEGSCPEPEGKGVVVDSQNLVEGREENGKKEPPDFAAMAKHAKEVIPEDKPPPEPSPLNSIKTIAELAERMRM